MYLPYVHCPADEFLSSHEKAPVMKELLVAINIGKDMDSDSSKLSSKTTSGQSSPLIIRGQEHETSHKHGNPV